MNSSLKYKLCDFAIMGFSIVLNIEKKIDIEAIFTTLFWSTAYVQKNAPIICPVLEVLKSEHIYVKSTEIKEQKGTWSLLSPILSQNPKSDNPCLHF